MSEKTDEWKIQNYNNWREEYADLLGRSKIYIEENREMREILLELAATTHQSKRLYNWYCGNNADNK